MQGVSKLLRKYSKTPNKGTILVSERVEKEETPQDQKADDDSTKEQ